MTANELLERGHLAGAVDQDVADIREPVMTAQVLRRLFSSPTEEGLHELIKRDGHGGAHPIRVKTSGRITGKPRRSPRAGRQRRFSLEPEEWK
jgi:hypothetical protein